MDTFEEDDEQQAEGDRVGHEVDLQETHNPRRGDASIGASVGKRRRGKERGGDTRTPES